ncbi:hypothetical protein SFUMM280S_03833 [Streptomyces fumanus]
MPNSRTRRETAEEVSSPATRKAAIRTTTESHRPTLVASEEAVDNEPETVSAMLAEVVTVVPEMFFWIADLTLFDPLRVGGLDVDRGDLVLDVTEGLGLLQREVEVGGGVPACSAVAMPMTLYLVPFTVTVEPVLSFFSLAYEEWAARRRPSRRSRTP